MAALAERPPIRHAIVGRIAVEMCCCEHDTCHPEPRCLHEVGPSGHPSAAVPPRRRLLIEPASVRQAAHEGQMWPTTALAPSSSDSLLPFSLPSVEGKKVTAAFAGGRLSSDGSVMVRVFRL